MVYVAAVVSIVLFASAMLVIAGMIVPNIGRISNALFARVPMIAPNPPAARAPAVFKPRVVAIRPLLRAAA